MKDSARWQGGKMGMGVGVGGWVGRRELGIDDAFV